MLHQETPAPRIVLPDRYYAVVGDTLQLFYRGIIEHPLPYVYNIETICDIGKGFARYYEITPEQAGEYTLTINLRDWNDTILASAQTVIAVTGETRSPEGEKTVLCVGDSLTASGVWCAETYRRLTATDGEPVGLGLKNIRFIGTRRVGDVGYEGYGGWHWASYTEAPVMEKLDIWVYGKHDKTDEDQHSLWTDCLQNVWKMETIEPSRIKFTRENVRNGEIPGGGGRLKHSANAVHTADIVYETSSAQRGNPFWDDEKGKVDFRSYCERNGFSGIDYVYTLLSWNSCATYRATPEDNIVHVENARKFLRMLHAQYPHAKVGLMGVQMPSLKGGVGNSYGGNSAYSNIYGLCRTAMGMNLAYQALANEEEFAGWVEFVNLSGQFDNEYNMPQVEKPVNTRSKITEVVETNGLHPTNEGYLQIGDAAYRYMAHWFKFK